MIFKVYILFFLVLFFNSSYSQTVLIKDKVPKDFSSLNGGVGPNRKNYSYSYFGIGKILAAPSADSVLSVKWNAFKFSSGYSKKYQANKYLGLLFDFDFSFESYALNKLDSITVINYDPFINRARYVFYKVGSDLALQFNLRPKRGNQLGTYITLGGYVDYSISRRFVTKSEFENGYTINQKTVYKKPNYTAPFHLGVLAKFGKHNWDIFIKYRISDAFINGQIEIPRLIVGLELLFHQ